MKTGFVSIIGKTNAGKSTLIKVLTGVYEKDGFFSFKK